MSDFRLFGQIQHLGPHEFYVFASAVAIEGADGTILLHAKTDSLQAAQAALDGLLIEVGRQVRERGGVVVDVVA